MIEIPAILTDFNKWHDEGSEWIGMLPAHEKLRNFENERKQMAEYAESHLDHER